MSNEHNQRNQTLDIMKGLAMLMTIFCHAQQRAMGNTCSETVIWQLVHWWHMPLFFIVSGFLASQSSKLHGERWASFLKGKALRLLWPWFIWRWLEWVFMRFDFSGLLPFNYYVHTGFLDNLKDFVLQPFRPMWFLFDLFVFFLFLTVVIQAGKRSLLLRNCLILLLAGASVIFYYACMAHGVRKLSDWGFLYYDIQYLGLFLYGYIYGKHVYGDRHFWKKTAMILLACAAVLLCTYELGISRRFEIIQFWTRSIIATSFVGIACMMLSKTAAKLLYPVKRGLVFMGVHSMEYYTLQFLFLNIGYAIENIAVRWAVNFAACMAVCTVLIVCFKRVGLIDMILWGNFRKRKIQENG